ncbi:MAG: aminodeoxychorismate/anthranilate synthase component II [Pirellulaceae bacterium]
MILVIDNYDSFVHNLARYVRLLGIETVVVRNDQISVAEVEAMAPQAIVLSPGPKTPSQAGVCLDLVRQFRYRIPILGICLGHQAIVEALGGCVVKSTAPIHGKASEVFHENASIFSGLASPIRVGRYHSLIAEVDSLPEELTITATTSDAIVMSVADANNRLVGLQFHPESILTESGLEMLRRFFELNGIECFDAKTSQFAAKFGATNATIRANKA